MLAEQMLFTKANPEKGEYNNQICKKKHLWRILDSGTQMKAALLQKAQGLIFLKVKNLKIQKHLEPLKLTIVP